MYTQLVKQYQSLCSILLTINPLKSILSPLPTQYQGSVANDALGIIENCIIFYEVVLRTINKICRIRGPVSLRHTIFYFLYTSPASGHMENCKPFIVLNCVFLAKDGAHTIN